MGGQSRISPFRVLLVVISFLVSLGSGLHYGQWIPFVCFVYLLAVACYLALFRRPQIM